MKTGIVWEIKNGTALVMKTGGEFVEVKADSTWQKGDVVILPGKPRYPMPLYAAAACFLLLFVGVFGGNWFISTETLLISMDINPSLELSINPLGRVIKATSYNEDATALLSFDDVKGLPYQQAINTLLLSDTLRPYLESNDYLEFAVYSKSDSAEITAYLNTCLQSVTDQYPQIQSLCRNTDGATAASAHGHHMSLGKYLAFLELQELGAEIEADDYINCGIGEIRQQIRQHKHNGQSQQDSNVEGNEDNSSHEGNSGNKGNSSDKGNSSNKSNSREKGNSSYNINSSLRAPAISFFTPVDRTCLRIP